MKRCAVANCATELQLLEADLAKGTPLAEALKARQLPELYKRMMLVGIKSGDLPGALTMLADYFQRRHLLGTRLKGLMVYPLIVLSAAFLLSCFLAFILSTFIWNNLISLVGNSSAPVVSAGLWMSPVFVGLALVVIVIVLVTSPARRMLRWRLPAFREASLAEVASALWLLLKNGVPLDDALALVEQLETGTGAEREIAQWRRRLAAGRGKFSEMVVRQPGIPAALYLDCGAIRRGFDRRLPAGGGAISCPRHVSFRLAALLGAAVFHSGAGSDDHGSN